jgi:hypothetical protein
MHLFHTSDGAIWIRGTTGLSRLGPRKDGQGSEFTRLQIEALANSGYLNIYQSATESQDGSVWLNEAQGVMRVRYREIEPPDTILEPATKSVASDDSILLGWSGRTQWDATPVHELTYEWRIDDEDWVKTGNTFASFAALDPGEHRFEVRTSAPTMLTDPTPAVHLFIVAAPWWRSPVVAGPGLLLIIAVLFQSARVVQRDKRLHEANQAMSDANKELFQVNVDLQREQVLERLRGQAQGMQSSEDIGPVVEAVYRELTGLGLPLIGSGVYTILSDKETETWTIGEDGRALEPFVIERSLIPNKVRETYLRGDSYWHSHVEGEEAKERLLQGVERGHLRWVGVPEERWPQKMDSYSVFFDEGGWSLQSEEPIAEEYLMLIKRFGEVFGYAHSRHKELQEKEAQNRRLAVEASVQRLRTEVQSMDEASDFERILSLLTDSLKTVELTFDGCEIDVLDEPVENPTMAHFEGKGFRCTTFRMDPQGAVAAKSDNTPAPFPGVIERTIERFIAGEAWKGTSEGEAIVEVPAGSYGRLRLTATDRDSFTDDEVATSESSPMLSPLATLVTSTSVKFRKRPYVNPRSSRRCPTNCARR